MDDSKEKEQIQIKEMLKDPYKLQLSIIKAIRARNEKDFLFLVYLYIKVLKRKTIYFVDPVSLNFINKKDVELIKGQIDYNRLKTIVFITHKNGIGFGFLILLLTSAILIIRKLKTK